MGESSPVEVRFSFSRRTCTPQSVKSRTTLRRSSRLRASRSIVTELPNAGEPPQIWHSALQPSLFQAIALWPRQQSVRGRGAQPFRSPVRSLGAWSSIALCDLEQHEQALQFKTRAPRTWPEAQGTVRMRKPCQPRSLEKLLVAHGRTLIASAYQSIGKEYWTKLYQKTYKGGAWAVRRSAKKASGKETGHWQYPEAIV